MKSIDSLNSAYMIFDNNLRAFSNPKSTRWNFFIPIKSNSRCKFMGIILNFRKYYHAICLDPPMILKFVNRFKWQCSNCKTCQQCSTSGAELIKCNTCDRTFHEGCQPMHISFGKTHCADCITCKNCNKVLPLLTISNQNNLLQIKGYRVCDECWKYFKM
jgi:hypothetical protein